MDWFDVFVSLKEGISYKFIYCIQRFFFLLYSTNKHIKNMYILYFSIFTKKNFISLVIINCKGRLIYKGILRGSRWVNVIDLSNYNIFSFIFLFLFISLFHLIYPSFFSPQNFARLEYFFACF